MKRWEHELDRCCKDEVEDALERRSSEGWELVAVQIVTYWNLFWKRPVAPQDRRIAAENAKRTPR